MAQLKILIGIDALENPDSGASGTVYQMSQGLKNVGSEVQNVWADSLPHKIKHGNLHYLLELPRAYVQLVKARYGLGETYDVIQISQPHCYLVAKYVKKNINNTVLVHQSNGLEPNVEENLRPFIKGAGADRRNFFKRMVSFFLALALKRHARLAAKYCDGTIVSNSSDSDYLIGKLGVPKERVALVAQGVADLYLSTPCTQYTTHRQKRLLFVGQYAFFKAPHILGRVASCIMRVNPDVEITWVCDKADHNKVPENFDEAYRSRVKCLPWCSQSELLKIYDEHGIFLFPSFFEGFGKVFLEAMSRGLCVVASNCGGMKDIITQGEDGFLVNVGDIETFVTQINSLLKDFSLAKRISGQARITSEKYSWKRTAEQMAVFYEKLGKSKLSQKTV